MSGLDARLAGGTAVRTSYKLDAMRLMALLELDLSDFEFPVRDLVKVREGDQFVRWRADLGKALDRIILLADRDLLERGEGLRILQEELVGKRIDLEKSTGRSKYLSEARAGNTTLVNRRPRRGSSITMA